MLKKIAVRFTKKSILLLLSIILRASMHTFINTYAESQVATNPIVLCDTIDLFVRVAAHETISSTVFYTLPYTAKKIVQRLNTCATNNSLKIYDPCTSAMAYLSLSISETNP